MTTNQIDINQRKIKAIHMTRKFGSRIAEDFPRIAEDYRAGDKIPILLERYHIQGEYGIQPHLAANSLSRALEILLSSEEREVLSTQHKREAGINAKKEGTGIFSLTLEELKNTARKGHLALSSMGGQATYRLKRGIHGLSQEEREKLSKEAVRAKGYIPFSEEEKSFLLSLSSNQEYYHISNHRNTLDYEKIAEEFRERFRIVRKPKSLKYLMGKLRREKNEYAN